LNLDRLGTDRNRSGPVGPVPTGSVNPAQTCSAVSSRYRCPTGRPGPPVARSGQTGPARCGPLRAMGHTGRVTYGHGSRPRAMARSVGHFIGPRATRATDPRIGPQPARCFKLQNNSFTGFTGQRTRPPADCGPRKRPMARPATGLGRS
jgi:hypothetical protein